MIDFIRFYRLVGKDVGPRIVALAPTLFSLVLGGCSSFVVNSSPTPTSQDYQSEYRVQEYRIQPGDQMDIKFFYNPELNESITVRPDGRVSLQLAQEILAAGLTPVELTRVLKQNYARELDRPEIAVIMRGFAGQRIYVDGEVNKPALVPYSAPMTVLQSIAVAGGLKDSARPSEIVVIRRGPEDKPRVFAVNLTRVLDGTDTGQDVALVPFDIVYVPKSPVANLNVWIDQYLRKNLPVSFGLSYQTNSN